MLTIEINSVHWLHTCAMHSTNSKHSVPDSGDTQNEIFIYSLWIEFVVNWDFLFVDSQDWEEERETF